MNKSIKSTTIASLPFISAEEAVKASFQYTPEIPAWPQLPKRSFFENMYVQYSEGFPGIVIDEKEKKISVNTERAFSELEKFYERFLIKDSSYFYMSKEFSAGFHEFYCQLEKTKGHIIPKCQVVGPVTFGLSIKDEKDQAIFYNEQLKDAVVKHILMKSIWQVEQVLKVKPCETLILFFDEPYLAAYGSAFTSISKEDITKPFKEIINTVKGYFPSTKIMTGIHCCGNTDWPVLLETDIDILSFDAYEFFESLFLYKPRVKDFINADKTLAWGIVPTKQEFIEKETAESLFEKLKKEIELLSTARGIKSEKITQNMIITPACGLGSCDEQTAIKSLTLLSDLTTLCKEKL